jgi:hypothetical protein
MNKSEFLSSIPWEITYHAFIALEKFHTCCTKSIQIQGEFLTIEFMQRLLHHPHIWVRNAFGRCMSEVIGDELFRQCCVGGTMNGGSILLQEILDLDELRDDSSTSIVVVGVVVDVNGLEIWLRLVKRILVVLSAGSLSSSFSSSNNNNNNPKTTTSNHKKLKIVATSNNNNSNSNPPTVPGQILEIFTHKVLSFITNISIMAAVKGNEIAMFKINFAIECLKILIEHGKSVEYRENILHVLLKAQALFDNGSGNNNSIAVVTGNNGNTTAAAAENETTLKIRGWIEQILDRVKIDMGDVSFIDLVSSTTQHIEQKREERRHQRKSAKLSGVNDDDE